MKTALNTPDQNKAIRSWMASRRAAFRDDGRRAAMFPIFVKGMTTADYIRRFEALRAGGCKRYVAAYRFIPVEYLNTLGEAPYHTGPEVEALPDLVDDAADARAAQAQAHEDLLDNFNWVGSRHHY